MMKQRLILKLMAITALVGFMAGSARAEKVTSRMPQGNNVGMAVNLGWGTPFNWNTNRPMQCQFPRGSGNMMYNQVMTICAAVTRDLDGDGEPEDTMRTADGSRAMDSYWASSYAYNYLAPLAAAGENLNAESRRIDVSYVWSSLDEENLEDWPIEAREGKTSGGAPVVYGAETIAFHSGDVFLTYYGPPPCIYQMWSCYFLNFGESNNMVYCHVWNQNMSEYMKWNPTGSYAEDGAGIPDGADWDGLLLIHTNRSMSYSGSSVGWMYHPARQITGVYGQTPTIDGFSPPEAPMMGFKMLNPPVYNEEVGDLVSFHTYASGEFGVSGINNPFVHLDDYGAMYRTTFGLYPGYYGGQINPWTGKTMVNYPGVLTPEDDRYEQWIWGGSNNAAYMGIYGELHDVAPRDSFSLDCVFMFAYPGVKPFTRPQFDYAEMDNPEVQDAFAPLEHYADVAAIVQGSGYQLPETPSAPTLTIVPGDREVTLTWTDVNIQTPDNYYYFLEENDLNPSGYYKEYDFEGYRIYRSYVGPNDSHSELLADLSLSGGNLKFHYIDKLEDDVTLQRMKNGQKVWYAVVPYDMNYDVSSGEMFSLPDPESGKVWNRPGQGLYAVIPRSNASEFKAAGIEGEVVFTPFSGTPVYEESVQIAGTKGGSDGLGCVFSEPPQYLAPVATVSVEIVNNERLTSAKTLSVVTSGTNKLYYRRNTTTQPNYGTRTFQLTDGTSTYTESGEQPVFHRDGVKESTVPIAGPNDASGSIYSVSMDVDYLRPSASSGLEQFRGLSWGLDKGGYNGAGLVSMSKGERPHWGWRACRAPWHPGLTRSGRFTIAWKDAGGGNLALEVTDVTRGVVLQPVEYPDDYGWGFVTLAAFGAPIESRHEGDFYIQMYQGVPRDQRTAKLVNTISASNTEEFGVYLNGQLINITGITSMPAAGTVFTYDQALGTWDETGTVFTQVPDAPYMGDKWEVKIRPSTMDPADIELSRIRVVPNPYVGSSFLDLSPASRRIEFVNLPAKCTIRIYSLGGNLVNVLNHIGVNRQGWGNYTDWDRLTNSEPNVYTGYDNHSGTEPWNMRNRFGVTVASGLYLYHVTDLRGETHTGSFYVVN
jgi:hypothetical protein